MNQKASFAILAAVLAAPLAASADTWENVSVIDTQCLSRFEARPDEHTKACALQCVKGGYGLIDADGAYLKFDEAGNQKALAALKATEKTDHLRATVVGERHGDGITVTSISIE